MTDSRAFLLTLAALVFPPGCHRHERTSDTKAASSATAASAKRAPSASVAAKAAPHPNRLPGLAAMAFSGAHELNLDDAQSAALDELADKFSPDDAAARASYKAFQSDVVAGMRSGKFDEARLKADYAAFDTAREDDRAREAGALNGLYATLDPPRREALVAALRDKEASFEAQPAPSAPDGGVTERSKQTLARLTQGLNLAAGQQARVGALLAKDDRKMFAQFPARRGELRKYIDPFLVAFEKDDFDAKKLDLAEPGGRLPHEAMEQEVAFLEQLVALLTPEQREMLAAGRSASGPPGARPPMFRH
jgi:Spy/CpxP family protein refolding chaperone